MKAPKQFLNGAFVMKADQMNPGNAWAGKEACSIAAAEAAVCSPENPGQYNHPLPINLQAMGGGVNSFSNKN